MAGRSLFFRAYQSGRDWAARLRRMNSQALLTPSTSQIYQFGSDWAA